MVAILFGALVLLTFSLRKCEAIKNPVIPGWNPDPSIIRVGSTYYCATSSFEYFPGIPIYKSDDLQEWTLYTHAFLNSSMLQLYGVPTGAGVWAPTLSHFNDRFYLASMTRWTYDPTARVWPRAFFTSSKDLLHWDPITWTEAWGIDPELFHDSSTGKTYLNLMAPDNDQQRLWGISQCEIALTTGKCIGSYQSLWNGTLPHNSTARPEGPKMFLRDGYYYLLIAEGGTDQQHRSTIARSTSPQGPFNETAPNNPLIFNGAYGFTNLTVQSTGHAQVFTSTNEQWYASFLARRNINGSSPLGRETFITTVTWTSDGWPVFNHGQPILLSDDVPSPVNNTRKLTPSFVDSFNSSRLDASWYQLRTPYTLNFESGKDGLVLHPNVFDLSHRDVPAALLRKQKSLNMTFTASFSPTTGSFGPRMKIGISAYLSELQHQDIGVTGCQNSTGICMYMSTMRNASTTYMQQSLNTTSIPANLTLHIRAQPLSYIFGYSYGAASKVNWLAEVESYWQAFAPPGWFVFEGNSFAIFASGGGEPWPYDAPVVGFQRVTETYYEEDIPDYDRW